MAIARAARALSAPAPIPRPQSQRRLDGVPGPHRMGHDGHVPPLLRGSLRQNARLVSGLILFAFALTHFLNHALGLISLGAMETFDGWRVALTRSLAGTVILAAALLVHVALALGKLARRRTLRIQPWEAAQLALGLAIPFFLLPHVVNTRVSSLALGINTVYPYELIRIWRDLMPDQTILLILVWVHGCIGLHYWLRLTTTYRALAPLLLSLAVLLPAAALMGVVVQGRAVTAEMADPARFAALKAATHWPDAATAATLYSWRLASRVGFGILAGAVLAWVVGRIALRRWGPRVAVQYAGGPLVKAARGPTLLEVSRMHGIPHASVCGGRARCSTCRVLVLCGEAGLGPPTEAERRTLAAIGAGRNIRLACQARLKTPVTFLPLVRLEHGGDIAAVGTRDTAGVERDLAVLFVDIRGFTALTERKLPYDVVFILNQFFDAVGSAVYGAGGWIGNHAGDGVLALFAHADGLGGACRAAVLAAADIDRAVAGLNERLGAELPEPLRIAMGLHCGPHVMGRMGVKAAAQVSVIGPAVNAASRLESHAKAANVQLVMSQATARHAGLATADLPTSVIAIRGSSQLGVIFVASARLLVPRLGPSRALAS
jgi:adenylate cyclase